MKIFVPLIALALVVLISSANAKTFKDLGSHIGDLKNSPTSCTMSGTYTIGASGDFQSIKRAIDSLKARGIAGNIIFELMSNYTSAGESFPIIFPSKLNIPCFSSANYGITLRPAPNATNLLITGAVNEGLIRLDTCNYLTIDGRAGGVGTTRQLSIINNWGTTVAFRNSSNNKLRYVTCITTTQSFTTTAGNIQFFSYNSLFGSNNNLVENCDISLGNGSGPTSLIYSSNGNNAKNFNDSIVNCNIHEFTSWTVYLNDSAIQWKIIGNSFYKQTPLDTRNMVGGDAIIKIDESYDPVGHIISNNYFGGSGPQCTGDPMQVNYNIFDFAIIRGFGQVAITNNYFRRINLAGTADVSLIDMGIGTTSPTHPVYGTIADNQFGGINAADSISMRNTYPTPNSNYGLYAKFINIRWGGVKAIGNEFNRIRFWASDTTLRIDGTIIQGCYSVRDNIIGNPSIYNSIVNATNGTMLMIQNGDVVNNTISNITNTSTAHINSQTPFIGGIRTTSDSVYNNKVFRITANSSIGCSSCQSFTEIVGIEAGLAPGNNPNHIVGNVVHSLINKGEAGDIIAIKSNGARVSNNFVHSLFVTNPINNYSHITGIESAADSTINNMILLGLDSAGNSMTLPVIIYGINGSTNVIHNTVAIVGTNVTGTSGGINTACSLNGNNIKNNIFYNTRSNQSGASLNRHYCIRIPSTAIQSNYNLYYNTGTGGYFGFNNSPLAAYQTFAAWKTGTGKDLNSLYGDPLFINPSGNYNQVNLHLGNGTIAEAAGIPGATNTLSKDFDNEVRASLTPVDIGADAGNFNNCAIANAGNDTTICAGASVQIGTTQLPNHTYSWTSNPAGYVSNLATPVVSPTVNTVYFLTLTNANATCTNIDSVRVFISAPITPTIIISTSTPTICASTSVTFTSSVTGAGNVPSYQWKINNVNAGTNSSTFSTSILVNGDQVSCILTSSNTCVTSNTASSNSITITVAASVVPSVNITTPNSSICAGESVTFTATPVNSGTTPLYQWKLNNINVGTNSNSFTSASLFNNDVVKVILHSSSSCATPDSAISNSIAMTVTAAATAHAGNDTSICAGSSIQLQGSGGTTYSWSPASGLSNPNIANPIATPLNTTSYILTVSNGPTCSAKDTVVLMVNPAIPASVNFTSSGNNICPGTTVTFTATAVNGGTSPSYQWKVNNINAGTNSNTFTSSALNNNDVVKIVLHSSIPCATADSVSMTMSVLPGVVANAGNDVSICAGSSTQLQGTGGTIYSWSPATGLSNPNIANPIASPSVSTFYVLTVSNGSTCSAKDTVAVTVNTATAPTVSINTSSNNICLGSTLAFSASSTNGGSNPSYQWRVNGNNVGTNNSSFTSAALANNDVVKVTLYSSNTCAVPDTAVSNVITMSVSQLTTPLLSLNNRTYTVTNPDAAATYTWQLKTNNIWNDVIPTATGAVFTATTGGEYRVKAVNGACTKYSASQVTARDPDLFNHPFGIYLYPNPTTGTITIDSIRLAEKWETLDLVNVDGKIATTINIRNKTEITLDISMLRSGTYFAILKKIDGIFYAVKFVKL